MAEDNDIMQVRVGPDDVIPQFWAEAMQAFPQKDPHGQMLLAAVIKQSLMGADLRHSPQLRLPVQSEGVILNRYFQLTDCPPGAVYALEWQRSPETTGNIYTSGWTIRRLFALYDANDDPLSSFILDDADAMDAGEPGRLVCLPHDEALRQSGISLLAEVSPDDLTEYLRIFPRFFGPDGEFAQKTGLTLTGEKIPLEAGIRFAKLSQELMDDPSHREDLFAFMRHYQEGGLMGLLVADDAQEAVSLLDAWRRCGQPLEFSRFLDGVNSVQASLETVDFYASAPVGKTLGEVLKRYVRGVVGAVSEGQIDWHKVQLAIKAFDDLVSRAYKLPMPVQLPSQLSFRGSFTDFVMAHGNDPEALGIIEPVVVELWIDEVLHHQTEDGMGGGGDPDEARRYFYQVLGLHLEESPSETTGDTPLELDRFEGIISGLVARGRLPSGYRLLDVGSRSGERILRPLIRRLAQSSMGPGTVVASDADPYPPPDAAWEFVLADFTGEGFPDRVGAPFDLITHAWSPINDETEGWNQQRALNNFSRSLAPGGYMVMDIPVGYEEEKRAYALAHGTPLGRIEKAFETPSGLTVAKDFMINELYDLVLRLTRAGLRVVNLSQRENPVPDVATRWTTGQGNERMTLVLEKVGEPEETLDLVWVGAGKLA